VATHVAYVDGRTSDGPARQAANADRLWAGIDARAAAGKPKSRCHARGVAYEDGRMGRRVHVTAC